MLIALFLIFFAGLGTLKFLKVLTSLRVCSDLYAHAEHTRQELMHTLRIRIKNEMMPSSPKYKKKFIL